MPVTYLRRAGAVCLTGALVAAVAACGSGPTSSDDYLSGALAQQVTQRIHDLDYPYDEQSSFGYQMGNLQTQLIHDCVEATGLKVPPTDLTQPDPASYVPDVATLWLTAPRDFGVARSLSDPTVLASLRAAMAGEGTDGSTHTGYPDNYDTVVYGSTDDPKDWLTFSIEDGGEVQVPVGGCFGQATQQMYGVPAVDYERARHEMPKVADVLAEAVSSKKVRSAVGAWSSCMAKKSYTAKDPSELGQTLSDWLTRAVDGKMTVQQVQAKEAALAVADKDCKTSSGLGTAADESFVDAADKALNSKQGVVSAYREMNDHALKLLAKRS